MAKGKKNIEGAEIGDIVVAKRMVTAYSSLNDFSSISLTFMINQRVGIIEGLTQENSSEYLIFSSDYDDGFGSSTKTTFYLLANDELEYKENPSFSYPDKVISDKIINPYFDNSSDRNNVNKETPSLILGITPATFWGILAGSFLLLVIIIIVVKSNKPNIVYLQSQSKTLSGVDVNLDKSVIPQMNLGRFKPTEIIEPENNRLIIPNMDFVRS